MVNQLFHIGDIVKLRIFGHVGRIVEVCGNDYMVHFENPKDCTLRISDFEIEHLNNSMSYDEFLALKNLYIDLALATNDYEWFNQLMEG